MADTQNKFYIYAHRRVTDGSVFYIGKGSGNRCMVKNGRSKHWHNIVNKHGLSIEILKSDLSLIDSLICEREMIKYFKDNGAILCNQTNGGDSYPGFVINDETKYKFRIAKLGKKQSPEHAKKSAMARLGKKNNPESTEKTISLKRKKIISSEGICFLSSCDAARHLTETLNKKCHQGIISMCATGKRNNAYGITWSYETSKTPEFKPTKKQEKEVINITRNMKFKSVAEACEWIKETRGSAQHQCISLAARSGGSIIAYGSYWKYT